MNYNLVIILGPTATGKTKLGTALAQKFNGAIISADSRQVYRQMDLGTGKDISEYNVNGETIQYYMIDIVEPNENFDLFKFKNKFDEYFEIIKKNNKNPFMVGGSSLYLHSIITNYNMVPVDLASKESEEYLKMDIKELQSILLKNNPQLHNTTDLLDKERIVKAILINRAKTESHNKSNIIYNPLIIGITLPNEVIKERINKRLKERLKTGMIEEVESLIKNGLTFDRLVFFGLEYKYIGMYLFKQLNYNDMYQKLNSAIYEFARKQIKWFRKMEREGIVINWVEGPDIEKASQIIENKFYVNE